MVMSIDRWTNLLFVPNNIVAHQLNMGDVCNIMVKNNFLLHCIGDFLLFKLIRAHHFRKQSHAVFILSRLGTCKIQLNARPGQGKLCLSNWHHLTSFSYVPRPCFLKTTTTTRWPARAAAVQTDREEIERKTSLEFQTIVFKTIVFSAAHPPPNSGLFCKLDAEIFSRGFSCEVTRSRKGEEKLSIDLSAALLQASF
jgi:hypothetical protein